MVKYKDLTANILPSINSKATSKVLERRRGKPRATWETEIKVKISLAYIDPIFFYFIPMELIELIGLVLYQPFE